MGTVNRNEPGRRPALRFVESGGVKPGRMANRLDETRQLIAIFTTIEKTPKTKKLMCPHSPLQPLAFSL